MVASGLVMGNPYPPGAPPPHPPVPTEGQLRNDRKKEGTSEGLRHLIADKIVDFLLIFVGLYAAMAVERCQHTARQKAEYVALLGDFRRELQANLDQEAAIAKDLGEIDDTKPGANLGPMQSTFEHFFAELEEDEKVVQCLHDEFVAKGTTPGEARACHVLYGEFEKSHQDKRHESFNFKPVVLTPFYRSEVWQLYLADGVKIFRNKELAVKIAEVYANARLIEGQVKDIESTYNDAFMQQVGRTAATDMELAEIVHDEEKQRLSSGDLTLLLHVDESVKEEHFAVLEVERILELKVERMKRTVLLMRGEIEAVQEDIAEELKAMGKKDPAATESAGD